MKCLLIWSMNIVCSLSLCSTAFGMKRPRDAEKETGAYKSAKALFAHEKQLATKYTLGGTFDNKAFLQRIALGKIHTSLLMQQEKNLNTILTINSSKKPCGVATFINALDTKNRIDCMEAAKIFTHISNNSSVLAKIIKALLPKDIVAEIAKLVGKGVVRYTYTQGYIESSLLHQAVEFRGGPFFTGEKKIGLLLPPNGRNKILLFVYDPTTKQAMHREIPYYQGSSKFQITKFLLKTMAQYRDIAEETENERQLLGQLKSFSTPITYTMQNTQGNVVCRLLNGDITIIDPWQGMIQPIDKSVIRAQHIHQSSKQDLLVEVNNNADDTFHPTLSGPLYNTTLIAVDSDGKRTFEEPEERSSYIKAAIQLGDGSIIVVRRADHFSSLRIYKEGKVFVNKLSSHICAISPLGESAFVYRSGRNHYFARTDTQMMVPSAISFRKYDTIILDPDSSALMVLDRESLSCKIYSAEDGVQRQTLWLPKGMNKLIKIEYIGNNRGANGITIKALVPRSLCEVDLDRALLFAAGPSDLPHLYDTITSHYDKTRSAYNLNDTQRKQFLTMSSSIRSELIKSAKVRGL